MMQLTWSQKSGFCHRIRQARLDAGIHLNRAAAGIGTTPSLIGAYERGAVVPSIARVYEMAQMYGCSIDWLVGGAKE